MGNLSPSTMVETGSVRLVEIGHIYRQDSTGRAWRFSRAGALALGRGKVAVSATVDAQRVDLSFAVAPAAGAKKVKVTIGTGNAAANDYRDGWLTVQDGAGEGRTYPIEGHAAITASTAGFIHLKETIDTLGVVSETNVDLQKNFYDGTVISVADQLDPVAGVPNVAIAATEYGFVQTYGPCSVWFDEIVAIGASLTLGSSVAGSVELMDAAGEPLVGYMMSKGSIDTEYQLVDLSIRA